MYVKMSFFEVTSEVQKDPEDISARIGQQKKYKVLNKFSCNLRSKSERSTLTSPSPIRVKIKKRPPVYEDGLFELSIVTC
jgi:hypothetical protein